MTDTPAEAPTPVGTPNQYRYAKAHLRTALENLHLAGHYLQGTGLGDHLYEVEVELCRALNVATDKSQEPT